MFAEILFVVALFTFFQTGWVAVIGFSHAIRAGKAWRSWSPLINSASATYIGWYLFGGAWA